MPLDWDDATCATSYKVVVKQDSTTGGVADKKTETQSQHTTKALTKGKKYYWQIKACNNIGCTKSVWWSFIVNKKATFEFRTLPPIVALRDDWMLVWTSAVAYRFEANP